VLCPVGLGPTSPSLDEEPGGIRGCSGGCLAPAAASRDSPALHSAAPGPGDAAGRGLCPGAGSCPGLDGSGVWPYEDWGGLAGPHTGAGPTLPPGTGTQSSRHALTRGAELRSRLPAGASPAPGQPRRGWAGLCSPRAARGGAGCGAPREPRGAGLPRAGVAGCGGKGSAGAISTQQPLPCEPGAVDELDDNCAGMAPSATGSRRRWGAVPGLMQRRRALPGVQVPVLAARLQGAGLQRGEAPLGGNGAGTTAMFCWVFSPLWPVPWPALATGRRFCPAAV